MFKLSGAYFGKLSGAFYQAQRSICSSSVEHIQVIIIWQAQRSILSSSVEHIPSSVEHIQVIKLSGAIFTTHGIKLGKT